MGILLIICVAITILGVAYAAEVTISDVKFNIPDGYTEEESIHEDLGDGLISDSKVFVKGDKNVTVGVLTCTGNTISASTEFKDPVNKVIDGKNGTYSSSEHAFEYKDGKKVIVIIDADEKFEDIIV